jgi:glycosyltransferase involved in cell wall biosynthesis
MPKYQVKLFYRKPHVTGAFSVEISFDQLIENFPSSSIFQITKYVLSHPSKGFLRRLRGILQARAQAGDINHVTGDVHYIVFGLPGERTILTIHDCGLMSHPNPMARMILKWIWLVWPVRHCRYVTAVSEATKRDIIRYTGCPPEKIVVIPTVIDDIFRPVAKLFDQHCPRILHVGMAFNKNFERHIKAIAGLNCSLHIIGKLEPHHRKVLEHNGIQYTSEYNISTKDMQRAYAECDLLLFASTLEGFGMPILEAQTVGRPVVTSNLSSMPEVAGKGACLVDPYSVEDIRSGVMRVIRDRGYRETLVNHGFRNIRRFSPETVARQYEDLYGRVVNA